MEYSCEHDEIVLHDVGHVSTCSPLAQRKLTIKVSDPERLVGGKKRGRTGRPVALRRAGPPSFLDNCFWWACARSELVPPYEIRKKLNHGAARKPSRPVVCGFVSPRRTRRSRRLEPASFSGWPGLLLFRLGTEGQSNLKPTSAKIERNS